MRYAPDVLPCGHVPYLVFVVQLALLLLEMYGRDTTTAAPLYNNINTGSSWYEVPAVYL